MIDPKFQDSLVCVTELAAEDKFSHDMVHSVQDLARNLIHVGGETTAKQTGNSKLCRHQVQDRIC